MMVSTFTQTETNLFNELFGSKNFTMGGVGRASQRNVLKVTTEERLIEAAMSRNAHVLALGTDYVVLKAGAPARRVYAYPAT